MEVQTGNLKYASQNGRYGFWEADHIELNQLLLLIPKKSK